MTRLIPGGWHIMIGTRWHMDDPMGRILPDDYKGESGMIKCKDGKVWEVLCIPAMCDRLDDPMGRKIGEYLWPEWFDDEYWALHRDDPTNARAWSSLFQQQPVPESGGQFEAGDFDFYEKAPDQFMRIIGASDWAVTERRTADWTEHGVWGIDSSGHLWELDWWGGQVDPDKGLEEYIRLVQKWKGKGLVCWLGEKGVIENAIGSARKGRMRQARALTTIELLPSVGDKVAKVASFRAMAKNGMVHFRKPTPKSHTQRVVTQLYQFPAGRRDDGVDVCGMAGRYASEIKVRDPESPPEAKPVIPFTGRWVEWTEPKRAKRLNTV